MAEKSFEYKLRDMKGKHEIANHQDLFMPSTFGTEYTEETDGGGTARTSQLKMRPGETVEQAHERV